MHEISQVLTFANWRGSISCGRIVLAAGAAIARAAPKTSSIAKTAPRAPAARTQRQPDRRQAGQRGGEHREVATREAVGGVAGRQHQQQRRRQREDADEAEHPGSLVRSYSSQPTATETICWPSPETIRPRAKLRTMGMRSASKPRAAEDEALRLLTRTPFHCPPGYAASSPHAAPPGRADALPPLNTAHCTVRRHELTSPSGIGPFSPPYQLAI